MSIPWNVIKHAMVDVLYKQGDEEYQMTMLIEDAITFVQDPTVELMAAVTPKEGVNYTSEILRYARDGFPDIKSYYGIDQPKDSSVDLKKADSKSKEEAKWDIFAYEKQLDEEEKNARLEKAQMEEDDLKFQDHMYFAELEARGVPKGVELSYEDEVYWYIDPISGEERTCIREEDIPGGTEYEKLKICDLPYYLAQGLIRPSRRR